MQIQWFPGHMHKARTEMRKTLPKVDLILEMLDARIPFSSENPMLRNLRADKACIKLLNKSDLADPVITAQWQAYLDREAGTKTLAMNAAQTVNKSQLITLCNKLLPTQAQSDRPIRVMVVGIPNVGKSTLINALAGRKVAKTGNQPAVTRAQQLIRLQEGLLLLDTPGVLWPNLENAASGYRLAVTGAIKDTAIEHLDVACFAADYLLKCYRQALCARYRIEELPESGALLLECIGRKRGCLVRGGQVDLDKAAKILLQEIRAGQLGPLSWETPSMMAAELTELARLKEEKAAAKAARQQPAHRL